MKSLVRYWFDTFEHLTSFDIVSYQDIVDLYMKNHTILNNQNFEKLGGDNERPLNSDVEEIDEKGFWLGYSPAYYNIDPYGKKVTQAKADVISMDMTGIGKTWSHFVYLELPYQFFNKYQTAVHSNNDISFYRKFLNELGNDLSKENVDRLMSKYDKIYTNRGSFNNFFREVNDLKWRQDLEIGQYSTIKENGIIYPVMYDSSKYILKRGTHRAFFLAHTKSNVPIFFQHPKLNGEHIDSCILKTPPNFGGKEVVIEVNFKNKSLKFFREGTELK